MEHQEVFEARKQVQKNLQELREGLDKLQSLLHPIEAKHSQFAWFSEDTLEEKVKAVEQVYKHPSYRQTSSKILNTLPTTYEVADEVQAFLEEEEEESAVEATRKASKIRKPSSSSSSPSSFSCHLPKDQVDFAFHPDPSTPLPKTEYQERFSSLSSPPLLPFPSSSKRNREEQTQCNQPLCTSADILSPSDIQTIIDRERVRLSGVEDISRSESVLSEEDSIEDLLSIMEQAEEQNSSRSCSSARSSTSASSSSRTESEDSWVVVDTEPKEEEEDREQKKTKSTNRTFSFSTASSTSTVSSRPSSSQESKAHRFKPTTQRAIDQKNKQRESSSSSSCSSSSSSSSVRSTPPVIQPSSKTATRPRYPHKHTSSGRQKKQNPYYTFPSWEERLFNPLLLNPRWPEESDFRRGRWQTEYSASYSQKKT